MVVDGGRRGRLVVVCEGGGLVGSSPLGGGSTPLFFLFFYVSFAPYFYSPVFLSFLFFFMFFSMSLVLSSFTFQDPLCFFIFRP